MYVVCINQATRSAKSRLIILKPLTQLTILPPADGQSRPIGRQVLTMFNMDSLWTTVILAIALADSALESAVSKTHSSTDLVIISA